MLEHATIQSQEISTHPQSHFGVSWWQVIPHIIHLELLFFLGKKTDRSFFGFSLPESGRSPDVGVGASLHEWEQQLLSPGQPWPQAEKHLSPRITFGVLYGKKNVFNDRCHLCMSARAASLLTMEVCVPVLLTAQQRRQGSQLASTGGRN